MRETDRRRAEAPTTQPPRRGLESIDAGRQLPAPARMEALGRDDAGGPAAMLGALQRTAGNAAVQRLLAPDPTVQRIGPAVPSVAGKHTVTFIKAPVPLAIPLDPIPAKITEIEGSAAGTFESEPVNEGDPGAPAAKVGALAGEENGIQAELEKSWDKTVIEYVTGMKPKVTEGAKITSTGGEVGVEGALEGTYVTFKLGFNFLEVKNGEIEWLPVKPGVEFPVKVPISLPQYGVKGTLEVKAAITLTIEPDLAAISKWLVETFGPDLLAAGVGGLSAGAAAAGFLVGTMYLMDDAHARGVAAGEAAAAAGQQAAGFSESFADVATGGSGTGGPGGAEGAQAADDAINKQLGFRAVVIEQNKQKGKEAIAREAYLTIAQEIYDHAKTHFREQHKDDISVGIGELVGIEDLGSGIGSHLDAIYIVLENKQPGGGPLVLRR